ncbi:hypothetical protein APA_1013 [Pseudanabaena sp. lw0831]|nr:hypothetical protein APA_1013 [Pseudanabaena sp. lw0831]
MHIVISTWTDAKANKWIAKLNRHTKPKVKGKAKGDRAS